MTDAYIYYWLTFFMDKLINCQDDILHFLEIIDLFANESLDRKS